MASIQQHCTCCNCRPQTSSSDLELPPNQLTRTMSTAQRSTVSTVFADAEESPSLQRTLSPGRAHALGYTDVAPPVHTFIHPSRLSSRRSSSSRPSRASNSQQTSRSSSVAAMEPAAPPMPTRAAPAAPREVFGETAAQRAERKNREREFWDIRKPHFWNMVAGGYSGRGE